ncbi:hypothetical protein [Dolosicoccus paucivorans]|uniref:hypothetical protein n=1 Tax=Dolosicoccus paucivorans TaxID=84521 RepID=UPI0008856ED4|nr:hypothetical protein [Dolosicoccus paucivorans]SDI85984.1 hypothetical protein SAMN04487994_10607 [Dolosicoccus paucivorans]
MKKLLFISSLGCLLLSGCKKEPMIHLNEDVQASIEAKQAKDRPTEEVSQLEVEESQVDPSQGEEITPDTPIEEAMAVNFDPSSWILLEQPVALNLVDYLPNKINQLKSMTNGQQVIQQYVEFMDNNQAAMQVIEVSSDSIEHKWYRWNGQQIIWFASSNEPDYFNNQLTQYMNQPNNHLVLLQAPLQVGTTWSYDQNYPSEITAIYQTAQINDQTYTNVIEVTSQLADDGEWKTYFAPEVGLLASVINGSPWVVQQSVEDASLLQPITVYESTQLTDNVAQMEPVEQMLEWRTNSEPKDVWMALFQKLHWMTQENQLNQVVKLNDQQVQVDFAPGIVNGMNQHPHQEYGVIPGIVKTIGAYYNVPYVQLTVNGTPLLPDYLMFPQQGMWQVDGEYKVETTSQTPNTSQESTLEEVSEPLPE